MNQITRQFIKHYESEHPEVVRNYGGLNRMYDIDLDTFFIEEIDEAYFEFKQGETHER